MDQLGWILLARPGAVCKRGFVDNLVRCRRMSCPPEPRPRQVSGGRGLWPQPGLLCLKAERKFLPCFCLQEGKGILQLPLSPRSPEGPRWDFSCSVTKGFVQTCQKGASGISTEFGGGGAAWEALGSRPRPSPQVWQAHLNLSRVSGSVWQVEAPMGRSVPQTSPGLLSAFQAWLKPPSCWFPSLLSVACP